MHDSDSDGDPIFTECEAAWKALALADVFTEVVVDHLRFLQDAAYREHMRREVLRFDRGALTMVDVEHEYDESCCRLESWGITLPRLLGCEEA